MASVLIVDDDTSFLLSIQEGLKFYLYDVDLITATNGEEALKILNNRKVDVVITDLKMPGMSGLELLSQISKYYPEIAVIFMTAFGTPKVESDAQRLGAVKYIEKPVELKSLADEIKSSLKIAKQEIRTLEKISLPEVLEILRLSGRDAKLIVEGEKNKGILFIEKGKLIDAEVGDFKGEEAFKKIARFGNPIFKITRGKKATRSIKRSPEEILREIDEWEVIKEEEIPGYEKLISSLLRIEESLSICIFGEDGKLIAKEGEVGELVEKSLDLVKLSKELGEVLPEGLEMMSFEGKKKVLLISKLRKRFWISLLLGKKVDLGLTRHLIRKAMEPGD